MNDIVDIAFPYAFDTRGRTMLAPHPDHVLQMIRQLLLTNPGERVNRPDFGGGLLQQVFAPNSPERAAAVELALQSALARWLGDVIDVHRIEVTSDDARLVVHLDYLLRKTGEHRTEVIETKVRP
ncbi:GPW/gp25 family protein [Rhodococcus aetherivorans]|uniref:GPW/gp25 family protein n=1 Tax=Rhodococcus aetherivorans TaxID=191292 RepID=UPI0036721DBE